MPRDPRDISVSSPERIQRRIAEAHDIREPAFQRSGTGPAGSTGPEGPAGENGATWFKGSTVPELALGKVGDFYFRTSTSDVYYRETAFLWTIIANIKGEKGETGGQGPAGSATMNGYKEPCRAATVANIVISTALNAGDVLDGVTLGAGDRVLVKDQTAAKENGIYIVGAVPARATDADASGEFAPGMQVSVAEGTVNADTIWQLTTNATITLNTTSLTFTRRGGAFAERKPSSVGHGLTESHVDIPGCTITLPDIGRYLITGVIDFEVTGAGLATLVGVLVVNGATQASEVIHQGAQSSRSTSSQQWVVTTTARNQVAKLQARRTGAIAGNAYSPHTTISAVQIL